MQLDATVLENRHVRLEPMTEAHREDLRAACNADPATWNDLYPFTMLGEASMSAGTGCSETPARSG